MAKGEYDAMVYNDLKRPLNKSRSNDNPLTYLLNKVKTKANLVCHLSSKLKRIAPVLETLGP